MKKILALLTVLCVLCLSAAAFADYVQSDGTPLELDGFTLKLEEGTYYSMGEKSTEKAYILIMPFLHSENNTQIGVNAVWGGESISAERFQQEYENSKASLADTFSSSGYTVTLCEFGDLSEGLFGDKPSVTYDIHLAFELATGPLEMYERQFSVLDTEYVFTLNAPDLESLDTVTSWFESVLTWQ